MKQIYLVLVIPLSCLVFASCNGCSDTKKQNAATVVPPVPSVSTPSFEADSAYSDIATQVALGPRTPGSAAQKQCADWMEHKLKGVCDTVYRQNTTVTGGDKKELPCYNLIGVIHPGATRRILLLTHWDSRPWADQDTKDKDQPVLAADDGGSGVAVLLEVARQLKAKGFPQDLGIDILFTDVEDYGKNTWGENSYCLGTQYWAHHPHVAGYRASLGILLDMVGARGAQFPLEGFSKEFAGPELQRVWQAASHAGYASFFPYTEGGAITDDQVPVNEILGIKTIDIINLGTDPANPFAPHWHTHNDNMNIIDKNTLKAVGQTLLQVIYETAVSA